MECVYHLLQMHSGLKGLGVVLVSVLVWMWCTVESFIRLGLGLSVWFNLASEKRVTTNTPSRAKLVMFPSSTPSIFYVQKALNVHTKKTKRPSLSTLI